MDYLDWLCMIAFPDGQQRSQYYRVLSELYNCPFRLSRYFEVPMDLNRAKDGLRIREVFEEETGYECEKGGECSVLELMIALAMRCEEQLMYDPEIGDRTHIWFFEMFRNLGFESCTDDWFNMDIFRDIIRHFLDRTYDEDGYGGPFYIPDFEEDMRKIELWFQLNFYLKYKFL